MKNKPPVTKHQKKILEFMTDKWTVTAQEIATFLTIENESACGHLFRLGRLGMVASRKAVTKNKDSHIKSRKVYFLTQKAKDYLSKTGSEQKAV
jgi:predicted ArsR family transcriptional regulator